MRKDKIYKYIERLILESTPERPLWNVEVINGKSPSWNYIDGCMMHSLLELYYLNNDKNILDFIIKYTDFFVKDDGTILGYDPLAYSLDDLSESRILFDLYKITGNPKYKKAIDLTYTQIKLQPRTIDGIFWHKPRHPHQVWLDGLFMGQVFYMRYETIFNNNEMYYDIRRQFETVKKYMFDPKSKLYFHGYDASKVSFWCDKKTGLSQCHWLRACGWHLISLIEILSDMDKSSDDFDFFKSLLKEEVEGIMQYKDEKTNMFYQVIDRKNDQAIILPKMYNELNKDKIDKEILLTNYLETSGSAMIAYSLMKGARLNFIDKKYHDIGKSIFEGICDKYLHIEDDKLNLGGICLMAGLGNNLARDGSFNYYLAEPVVSNDAKGVGPFIMAFIEYIR